CVVPATAEQLPVATRRRFRRLPVVRLRIAALGLLLATPALAQQCGTLTTCPPVSTPLGGTELLYTVQGGVSKKMTATQLGAAIGPLVPLAPGSMNIIPSTNGGLLWDNNGVLADSKAPLQTAIPSTVASNPYCGTAVAGVMQACGASTVLPNGTTATTQPVTDISGNVASDAFVVTALLRSASTLPLNLGGNGGGTYSFNSQGSGAQLVVSVSGGVISGITAVATPGTNYAVGDIIDLASGNNDNAIHILTVNGSGGVLTAEVLYGG